MSTLTRIAVLGAFLALAACSGGGGSPFGGGGGGGGGPPLFDCTGGSEFDYEGTFSDGKTYCAYGPGTIKADAAYAKGATGAGAVVAVIDTGIDPAHTELDANISPDSIDIVRGDPMTDEDGHGTHIAGIIAGEKNGVANHGVAYDATILAIRADTRITNPTVCGGPDPCSVFFDADITAALNYAASRSANVINMSLGGPAPLAASAEQALIDAMTAGAVIFAATGNDGVAQPAYPAAYAGDGTINVSGQMVAVGAVDKTGALASFSNRCGDARNFCLVAPGVDIISDLPGNSLAVGSGTSQAAAFVSGGAALLIGTWPTLTPDEVVTILLTSATDLGAAGVDALYGHGLLNMDAAVAPLGTLTIPLTDSVTGETVVLEGTVLSLGPAFGDALKGSLLLGQALALDDFDRDFVAGLEGHVIRSERGFGLDALMTGGGIETIESALPNGAKVSVGMSDQLSVARGADTVGLASDASPERQVRGMSLAVTGGDGTAYRFGYGMTPGQLVADAAVDSAATLFWMSGDLLNPQHALVGAGAAFSASRDMGSGNLLSVGLVDQSEVEEDVAGGARIGEIEWAHEFAGGAVLTARFSNVDERSGFLGSDAAGGFAVAGADSRFYVLGGRLPLGAGVEVLGSYTVGRTNMASDGTSLLGDWSDARADAFGVGIVKNDAFGTGSRIGFLAGQPLRVNSASARLTVPVEYGLDKTVVQDTERVSLVPTGREIDLQLAYERSIGTGNLSGWLMMQLEPGHDADAPPAYGIGIRFAHSF